MRIMALDYGDERIGVAMTDLLKILAKPYCVYKRKHSDEDYVFFEDLIKTEQVDTIIMGLPTNLEGEEQEITFKARNFGEELKNRTNIKLIFVDERMSSVVADDILKETEKDWKKRKAQLDMYSAMVILQDYLDYN